MCTCTLHVYQKSLVYAIWNLGRCRPQQNYYFTHARAPSGYLRKHCLRMCMRTEISMHKCTMYMHTCTITLHCLPCSDYSTNACLLHTWNMLRGVGRVWEKGGQGTRETILPEATPTNSSAHALETTDYIPFSLARAKQFYRKLHPLIQVRMRWKPPTIA